jgi:hypothetical protein
MKQITIKFHFPHDKFSLGWEIMYPDEKYDTHIISISLLLMTIDFEF